MDPSLSGSKVCASFLDEWHMHSTTFHSLRRLLRLVALHALLAFSAAASAQVASGADHRLSLKLIAFNDLHGWLEPSSIALPDPAAPQGLRRVPAGGAANLAATIARLRAQQPNTMVITAGDMVGASPLSSALTLDEGTIEAMNLMGVDVNAVGNHEFDRGVDELRRLQQGGCARHTALEPCRVSRSFAGASFRFLAANVITPGGSTLFPATARKTFTSGSASVTVGVIGLTLKDTPTLVTPSGVQGLRFQDEAATVNALVPRLRAEGADIVVVAMHQGGWITGDMNDASCPGLTGAILPVLDRLDPTIDVVITGHTHRAYACDHRLRDPARPFLVTSAGQYGTLVTDIDIEYDTRARKLIRKSAVNRVVDATAAAAATDEATRQVASLVMRYQREAEPLARRAIGRLASDLGRDPSVSGESHLGNVVADAQWFATRDPKAGGSELALMNPGGLRADLIRDPASGSVTYAQLFAAQPFGNTLVVMTLTGKQLRELLEQQFPPNQVGFLRVLLPSRTLSYSYDLNRPAGQRVAELRVAGQPVDEARGYRVTVNSFLAAGGDRFTVLREGRDVVGGPLDVSALEDYLAAHPNLAQPDLSRIRGDRNVGRTQQ